MEGFVLKILSGQQAGAEVLLATGEYSIGSADEDDLQFNDLSLKAGHARLRVLADAVEIRAEAGSITSGNGLDLEIGDQEWRELEQLDIISAGMTRFAVGAATANWASIVDAMKPEHGEDEEAGSAGRRKASPFAGVPPLRDLPARALLAVFGFLAVVAIAAWMWTGEEPVRTTLPKADPQADFSSVSQAMASLPFPHSVEVRQEVDGAIFVSGYVKTLAERRAIVNAVEETGVQAGLRIWVIEVMRNGFASLLESAGFDLDFDISESGVLTIRGVVLDKASADRLLALVQEQTPGLRSVESDIRTAEDLLAEVRGLARRAKIDDTVLLRLEGTLIEASGLVGADKIDLWAGFVESYVRNFADIIPMRSYVQLASADNPDTPQIAAPVDETGRAYGIETSDGSRIYGHEGHVEPALQAQEPQVPAERDPSALEMAAGSGLQEAASWAEMGRRAAAAAGSAAAPTHDGTVPGTDTPVTNPDLPGDGQKAIDVERAIAGGRASQEIFALSPSAKFAGQGARNETASPDMRAGLRGAGGLSYKPAGLTAPTPAVPARVAPGRPEPMHPQLGDTQIAAALASLAPIAGQSIPACTATVHGRPDATPASDKSGTALELRQLTLRLLQAWRAGKLYDPNMPEGMAELASALELISRVRKESAALQHGGGIILDEPFAGLYSCPAVRDPCWSGAKLDRGNLPAVIFWLDILSISETTSLAMFQPHNQALILEAGLNPKRLAKCAMEGAGGDSHMSIFIADSVRNPGIINAVTGRLDRYAINISGANLKGQRFVQTSEGEKLQEGAAPTADSRLLHIGELGTYFRTARGLAVAIYDPRMTWYFDG